LILLESLGQTVCRFLPKTIECRVSRPTGRGQAYVIEIPADPLSHPGSQEDQRIAELESVVPAVAPKGNH
jgi:hypothetical protein